MNNKQLGQRIAELRKQNNLSQKELADKLCVSNKTISKWECGNGSPDFDTMQKLANIFSISLDDFSKTEKQEKKQEENKQIQKENTDNNIEKNKITLISSIVSSCIVLVLTISLLCYFFIPRNPKIEDSNLFTINQEQSELYCTVDNDKEMISLGNTLELPRNNKWKLYYDVNGMIEISSKTVNLQAGDNVFYIVIENTAGETKTYKTTIRRKPLYVVKFDTNGGEPITQQLVMEDNFAEFETPIRDGYIFNSWDYDFSKPITSNITITASWIPKNLTITYFANNGTENSSNQNVTYDTQVNLKSENEFTKKGYTLSSWNTKSDGSGESFATNKSYTKYNIAENLTLFAQWTINQYDITATKNLENAGVVNGQGCFDYNSTKTLTAITNEGYTWGGWYTTNGVSISTSQSLQLTLEDNDIEVCARWTANKYSVNLNANGGDSISLESKELTFGEGFTLPTTTRTEATFLGWFDENDNQYTNASGTSIINWNIARDTILYAHYKINEYQVNLSKNISVAGNVSGNGLKEYGSTVNLSAQTNDGYSFVGWYLGNEQITTNTTYSFVMSNYPITYTAKWKANDYVVNMEVNGGIDLSEDTKTIIFNTTFTLPITTKDGYTFAGWYLGTNGTGTQITDNNGNSLTAWNIADNKTLYAKWNIIDYGITYILNGGTNNINNPATYNIEDLDIQLNYPTKDGYIFNGWVAENSDSVVKDIKILAGSYGAKTFGASWALNTLEAQAISNAEQLQNIEQDGIYYLTNNIDLSGIKWSNISRFEGILDGCGYTISNFTTQFAYDTHRALISQNFGLITNLNFDNFNLTTSNMDYTAIVCLSNYGTISNINIKNSTINATYCSEVGFVCETNGIGGVIKNCKVSGIVTGKVSTIGGVCSTNAGGLITNCYVNVDITNNSFQSVAGVSGGISAYNVVSNNRRDYYGKIQNCFFVGSITGLTAYGISCNSTIIQNCFVDAVLNGETNHIVNSSGLSVNSVYYSNNINNLESTENGVETVDATMFKNKVWLKDLLPEFVNSAQLCIDDKNVWVFEDNEYPKLYWEN